MKVEEIEAFLRLFERSSLTEMAIEWGGMRLTFKRHEGAQARVNSISSGVNEVKPAEPETAVEEATGKERVVIRSPMVGIFHSGPKADSAPFVKVGDQVRKGDALAVIQAMKFLTEVKAPEGGTVEEILVQDGQPVEYGQELMIINRFSG